MKLLRHPIASKDSQGRLAALGVALCAVLGVVLALSAPTPAWADDPYTSIEYQGELLGADRKPVSGIYPLEFRLYRNEGDRRPAWRELHWVSIQDGEYSLSLGKQTPIRRSLARKGQLLFLGITLKGGGELLREPIDLSKAEARKDDEPDAKEDAKPDAEPEPAAEAKPAADAKPAEAAGKGAAGAKDATYRTESSFAELADYAKRAGVAEDAEKLGGKTVEELEAEIERLRTQIAEHRTDTRLHSKGRLGSGSRLLPRVGGTGGTPYARECPEGHVVTGIRGGAGALMDSIQLICSPLE